MLGAAYLAGKGVARDRARALHWLEQAETGGAGELAAGFLKLARASS
jgi:TPR repeat protein